MDELIKLVMQRTGLAEGTAKITLQVIIGYFKDKLPASAIDQIEDILEGGEARGQMSNPMEDSSNLPVRG